MIDAAALDILLNDRRIGTLARLDGDRSIFTFDEAYLADEERPTLSLAYRDQYGAIINAPRAYQTQIEPFFSNLLPEGALRDYLARRAGIKPVREYLLLAQLGGDLPGAVKAVPVEARDVQPEDADEQGIVAEAKRALRFSLAGVQLKFSALKNRGKNGGLTIPVSGMGGDWSSNFPRPVIPTFRERIRRHEPGLQASGFQCPEIRSCGRWKQIRPDCGWITPIRGVGLLPIRRFDRTDKQAPSTPKIFAASLLGLCDDKYWMNASLPPNPCRSRDRSRMRQARSNSSAASPTLVLIGKMCDMQS